MAERRLVRAHLLRNTVHLLTAGDFLTFRPLFQSVMERALAAHFGRRLTGVDPAELREVASALLAQTPLTRTELARRLAQRWPGHDPGALAYAATHLLQLVQVPPRGIWGSGGPAAWFLAAACWSSRHPRQSTTCGLRHRLNKDDPVPAQVAQRITVGAWTTNRS